MQPIFFGPRSSLQVNLSKKIDFWSAYCHIHGTWVPQEVTQDLSKGLNGCAYSLTSPYRHLYNTDTSLFRTVRLVPEMPKSYIPNLFNTNTSVNRTLGSVPLVPVLKRFDCIKLARLPKVASARGLSIVCMSYFSCQAIHNTPLKFLNVNGVNVFVCLLHSNCDVFTEFYKLIKSKKCNHNFSIFLLK